jgi:hypothetical protein
MEKKLKRRQGDEGKIRRSREESPSQKMKVIDLMTWNLSIQLLNRSLRIPLNYFAKCLTLPNNLENPPSIFRSP